MSGSRSKTTRFHRALIVVTAALFGAGTVVANFIALFVPPNVPIERPPVPFLVFDAAMGLGYLVAAWAIGLERRWSLSWVWGLAALHAVSASMLAALWVFGGQVPGSVVAVALGRESYWVLIGLYLWRSV